MYCRLLENRDSFPIQNDNVASTNDCLFCHLSVVGCFSCPSWHSEGRFGMNYEVFWWKCRAWLHVTRSHFSQERKRQQIWNLHFYAPWDYIAAPTAPWFASLSIVTVTSHSSLHRLKTKHLRQGWYKMQKEVHIFIWVSECNTVLIALVAVKKVTGAETKLRDLCDFEKLIIFVIVSLYCKKYS